MTYSPLENRRFSKTTILTGTTETKLNSSINKIHSSLITGDASHSRSRSLASSPAPHRSIVSGQRNALAAAPLWLPHTGGLGHFRRPRMPRVMPPRVERLHVLSTPCHDVRSVSRPLVSPIVAERRTAGCLPTG